MGLASNVQEQRILQLEKAIKWHAEEKKANAGKKDAPAPVVPKVKNTIAALRPVGTELATVGKGLVGLGERKPQDSVYYHPTLNPSGRPPAGKPQKYRATAEVWETEKEEDDDDEEEEYAPVEMYV